MLGFKHHLAGLFYFMSYPDQEGPRLGQIPAQIYKTCSGCKYHNRNLMKSGEYPLYRDDCTHETAPNRPMKNSFSGNLKVDYNQHVIPGDWCPLEPVNYNPYSDT